MIELQEEEEGELDVLDEQGRNTPLTPLTSETDFVNRLRKGERILMGRYRYAASEDKFPQQALRGV